MPVYEYCCEEHGVFEARQPISAYDQPSDCPSCGESAPRVLFTAPRLGASDRVSIQAHDVNAKAADSPKMASQQGHVHGPGCGCGSGVKKSQTLHHPNGAKSFPAKRPWMVSH